MTTLNREKITITVWRGSNGDILYVDGINTANPEFDAQNLSKSLSNHKAYAGQASRIPLTISAYVNFIVAMERISNSVVFFDIPKTHIYSPNDLERNSSGSGVYFYRHWSKDPLVKVGFTDDLNRRTSELWQECATKSANDEHSVLLFIRTKSRKEACFLEQELHSLFRQWQVDGEWFYKDGVQWFLNYLSTLQEPTKSIGEPMYNWANVTNKGSSYE